MTDQSMAGVPAHILEQFASHEAVADLELPKVVTDLLSSQGLDLELEPRKFLEEFFKAHGRSISDDEIEAILDQYTVVPYVGEDDGAAAAAGGGGGDAPSVGRLADGRRITVVRKMNRNRKLEALNMTGGLVEAAAETKRFKDAAGLGDAVGPEKMNLEAGERLPPLAFGSAHSVFFDSAEAALEAMKQQALVAAAMVTQLSKNVEKAKEVLETQRRALEIEAYVTGAPVGEVPMTGAFRAIMNQSKMIHETYAVGVSSWLSGIYLPKIISCLLAANTRPQSRLKVQTLLAKLDALSSKLGDDDQDIPDELIDELDAAHAAVYAEIRRAGLTAALTKQMRGPFSSFQKREDHQHARFVTASLREELYYFIATGPMSVGRRMTLHQYPLPRMLVAAERFLDADVNGTVDAFRTGMGHVYALVPPDAGAAGSFTYDQFDTGGSIQNITGKTTRPERTGAGVEEAEAALRAPGKTQVQRHAELEAHAWGELGAAEASSLKLNITNTDRSNADRAELREKATQRARPSGTEPADFVRAGNFVYVTEKAGAGVARSLKPIHARTSIHHGLHAPAVHGDVLVPARGEWMDGSLGTDVLEASVAAMLKARHAPAAVEHGASPSPAPVDEPEIDISEKKRGVEERPEDSDNEDAAPKRTRRTVTFADDDDDEDAAPLIPPASKDDDEDDDDAGFVRKPKGKSKRSRAPAAPRGRRMTRTLGVREDDDDEDAVAALPPEPAAVPPPRVPLRTGLRGGSGQLTSRGARALARCDGTLIPPPNIPAVDDESVTKLVEARLIPGLMSATGVKSISEFMDRNAAVCSMLSLSGSKSTAGAIQSSLINRAIVNNLVSFAKSAPVNSALLGSFLATFTDVDPLMDGPALGDDE